MGQVLVKGVLLQTEGLTAFAQGWHCDDVLNLKQTLEHAAVASWTASVLV